MTKNKAFITLLALLITLFSYSGNRCNIKIQQNDSIPSFIIEEVIVLKPYKFENDKQERKYKKIEKKVRKVYPLLLLVREEYKRVNSKLTLYEGKQRKKYLKRYEKHARDHYLSLMSGLSPAEGRLFLKLIERELNITPYEIIKTYRNGLRASLWQGVAFLFFSNLKTEYNPKDHPMLEHILQIVEKEYNNADILKRDELGIPTGIDTKKIGY